MQDLNKDSVIIIIMVNWGNGGHLVTNSDKQLQTVTNSCKQRQTVTKSDKQRQTETNIFIFLIPLTCHIDI
jgi:hypothetical protein